MFPGNSATHPACKNLIFKKCYATMTGISGSKIQSRPKIILSKLTRIPQVSFQTLVFPALVARSLHRLWEG
ncbi:MAG: hypothetical protein DRH17_06770 [Deltaproteobacteria bacterium]|nr:MAG: hypothetical protein DRH17_06770 [Deltaproteobacteria bacterium]